jgi:hypothetical protein
MFLDKFELVIDKIDDKVCGNPDHRITFWSSGKVEVTDAGATKEVSKAEISTIVAAVGAHYQVTPEEFATMVEKHKADHSKGRNP